MCQNAEHQCTCGGHKDGDYVVCRCEEVYLSEIKEAIAKGVDSFGELRRLTRAGMGLCQGMLPLVAYNYAAHNFQRMKETVKKAPVAKKPVVKEEVNFQFSGKSYTSEDLIRITRDVWKYDLNGKEEDVKSIELYVKPEENTAYYVINGDVTGSFFI